MSKTTVTKLFIGSLIAGAAGAILGVTAIWTAIANDVFVMAGQDIVGIEGGAFGWLLLGLGAVGGVIVLAGFIGGLVAWIGALLDSARLERKTWFVAMLLLGIFNLGILAMIAYVIGGPDGSSPAPRQGGVAPVPA